MKKYRFRWADEEEIAEGPNAVAAFEQVREKHGILPLDTTIQIDIIEEGTS